jgi:hypothetical protein
VLGPIPSGADSELDAPAAHGVDLGDGDGEGTGEAERCGGEQRAEPDALCLAGEARKCDPRVGRAWQTADATHLQVVVRAEERPEAILLRRSRHGEQLVVCRSLLGFGEDAQLHGSFLPQSLDRRATGARPGGLTGARITFILVNGDNC